MRKAARRLAVVLVLALAAVAALFAVAPHEPLGLVPAIDAAHLPDDLDSYLRDREAVVGGITPGAEAILGWVSGV